MDQAASLPAWQVLLYLAATFLLSLLLAKRSQVDAWAEANPRIAGLLKMLRGAGIDPWLIVQGVVLFATGRLPASLRPAASTDEPPKPPKPPAGAAGAGMALAFVLVAAALAGPGCGPPPAPCSQDDFQRGELALIVAGCATRRAQVCPGVGVDGDCPAVDKDCDEAIEKRCGGAL
jgi:hypothetical protein